MNEKNKRIKELNNILGKRKLEETKLNYSKEITNELKKNPDLINEIIEKLGVTQEDLYKYLSGEELANISIYDEAYLLVKNR